MVYNAIGLMSGSSLKGLDMVFVQLQETAGKWTYEILHADCQRYSTGWMEKLADADNLSARDYQLLHTAFGHYTGEMVNRFIDENNLHHRVHLVASHGHTIFHMPQQKMTAQLGDGAAIAAVTGLPVVSDLRAIDMAFGGQGAPIIPIGEKLLLQDYNWFLNMGGIASLSLTHPDKYISLDVCPANLILNLLVQPFGKTYDDGGEMAAAGTVSAALLDDLDKLDYYRQALPKSLSKDFDTAVVYPLIQQYQLSAKDALRTYVEHIAVQIKNAAEMVASRVGSVAVGTKMLVTGDGAFNTFMVERLREQLQSLSVETVVPGKQLVIYKEVLTVALMGILRWREEYNVLSSVTGAARNSINGALWLGGEA